MRFITLILLGILCSFNSFGQHNPANRYIDAYKQYLDATCPLAKDSIKHFVYFSKDRELIHDHPLLKTERFVGAQFAHSHALLGV